MRSAIRSVTAIALFCAASPCLAEDPYQWLEAPRDPKAMNWAKEETARSQAEIRAFPVHGAVEAELRQVLAKSDPAPSYYPVGSMLVRFQRSVKQPHGLLSVANRQADGSVGAWRDVLDVDALRKVDGMAYEFRTTDFANACLAPDYTRCLIQLSPDGADETILREFDLSTGQFVKQGFEVPASRTMASWLGADMLLLTHTVGSAELLPTKWARGVYLWKRGTPLAEARQVFKADAGDAILALSGANERRHGAPVGILRRFKDYSTSDTFLIRPEGAVEKAALPTRLKMSFGGVGGGWLVVQMAEPAEVNGEMLPAETMLALDVGRDVVPTSRIQVVSKPTDGEFMNDSFTGFSVGSNMIRMVIDRRGLKRIDTARYRDGQWTIERGKTADAGVSISLGAVDPTSGDAIVTRTGFILPTQIDLVGAAGRATTLFREQPVIDADKFVVELNKATSKDGTEIDYFLLRPRTVSAPGRTPTLMTGYGAFGLTISPGYFDYIVGGRSLVPWLTRGGALVLPLIRGGGDRGAAWHEAALRENRQRSYDDFAAVTEALIRDGFTSPKHIGVFGTSNGGLLAATMGTQRPDLYGAIVSDVPLTDLIRMPFMGMGAAWTNEYGDPADPKMAKAILRYSPYQNVTEGKCYPAFLVTVATSDNRVGPGHARKLAAKLESAGVETYFMEDQEGGHGVSDPLSRPDLMADRMAFLIDKLM